MNEYTWSELDGENIEISMDGHKYRVLSGPEEALDGWWWAPGFDEGGKAGDMYFERTGLGQTESFRLTSAEAACL
jgi:hypothetical protein